MVFSSMFPSDPFGFGSGGGYDQFGNNMHDSNYFHLMNNPSLHGYESTTSFGSGFNGLNHFDGTSTTTVTRQLMFADGHHHHQNMGYNFTAVDHPPAILVPQGQGQGQFGGSPPYAMVVERSVVETVTCRPFIQPLRHVSVGDSSPYYRYPKNCKLMEIEEEDDHYDIKPCLMDLQFPSVTQKKNNNNNSVFPLQIEGPKKKPDDENTGEGRGSDEYKTRSLKHRKYGPYTCPRCKMEIETSQSFASHMKSHYSSETHEEKKKRREAKYKKKNLRVALSREGITLVPRKWTQPNH